MRLDPVYEYQGLWWFWDETWANRYGPFYTKQDAQTALSEYCQHVLEGGNVT